MVLFRHAEKQAPAPPPRDGQPLARKPSTVADGLRLLGRVLFWLLLVVVVLRGSDDLLGFPPAERSEAQREVSGERSGFPNDDRTRAFATQFAKAYLEFAPGYERYYRQALAPYLDDELLSDSLVQLPDSGPPQRVTSATVADAEPLGANRGIITVAVVVEQRRVTYRRLAVPVARDGGGGLVVYDLPSFSPAPAKASVQTSDPEPVADGEEPALRDLLGRFFPVFLSGRDEDLSYFLPAGERVGALDQRYEFLELVSFGQAGQGMGRRRTLVCVVRARDEESRAVYTMRWRLAVVKRDRWLVTGINTT